MGNTCIVIVCLLFVYEAVTLKILILTLGFLSRTFPVFVLENEKGFQHGINIIFHHSQRPSIEADKTNFLEGESPP